MRHLVLEAEEAHIVVGGASVAEELDAVDEGVEGNALCNSGNVQVLIVDEVVGETGLIANGCDELIGELELGVERKVLGIGGGQMGREGDDADTAGEG